MYHVLKDRTGDYLGVDGLVYPSRADAVHVDVATFKALRAYDPVSTADFRLMTVTNRADRMARMNGSASTTANTGANTGEGTARNVVTTEGRLTQGVTIPATSDPQAAQ